MVVNLCQMLAPILAFTADEAWEYVPGKTVNSAHQLTWQPVGLERPEAERATWKALFELRELALPELEKARQAKAIGKALEAKLTFDGSAPALATANAHLDALRELLNVSQLEIKPGGETPVTVAVSKAAGEKCERCWHWETDVGSHAGHPTICARCVKAVQASARV
jgi:isoleucyl-tRNA synthetase